MLRPISLSLALFACALPAWAQVTKPPVREIPANPNYYRRGRGGQQIRYVVIHTIEGSAGSGINTFRSGGRRVSAHYIVDFDGAITQMVADQHTAWHAGNYNSRSIGIEHAGWAGRNRWTPEQMRASARLTRWLCDTYGIPIDRQHIVAHKDVPGATHSDPGRYFNWDLYMRLVRGEGGTASPTPPVDPAPGPAPGAAPVPTPVRPARGEVLGGLRFDRASGGLQVAWNTVGSRAQQAARVQLEEIGGARRYDSGSLPGAGEQHLVPGPFQHGRRYRWRVRAFDGVRAGESAWTEFQVDLTPPSLTVTSPTPDQLLTSTPVIRWRYSDADGRPQVGYRIQLDDDADHTRIIGDTKELNGEQAHYFLRAHLQPGRTYHFRVGAHDGRGNLVSSEWRSFRTSLDFADTSGEGITVKPLTPRQGALVATGTRPVLRWAYHSSEQQDQLAFRIVIARDDAAGTELVNQAYQAPGKRGYIPSAPLAAGRYKWRVRVWDGKNAVWSEWAHFVVTPAASSIIDRIR